MGWERMMREVQHGGSCVLGKEEGMPVGEEDTGVQGSVQGSMVIMENKFLQVFINTSLGLQVGL